MNRRVGFVVFLCCFLSSSLSAQNAGISYEILALGGTNGPGARPYGGLVLGPDGNYYGTATEGGAFGGGTIFKMTPDRVLTTLVSFRYEEGNPREALIVGSDGHLYGTTQGALSGTPNSKGTIFRVTLAGELTTLATFVNESNPAVAPQKLIEANDGHLYGTTTRGGAQNQGSVFRLTKDGTLTTLVSFTGANGAWPEAGLIEASDGQLYGTTEVGGANNTGTVFRVTKDGVLTTLPGFPNSDTGGFPRTELTQGPDGDLYGVSSSGGTSQSGKVFRITFSGTASGVASLPQNNVAAPSPLVLGDDGNFYGTTVDDFYRVTPAGELTVLVDFAAQFEGRQAEGPLLKIGDGQFLGTTYSGGSIGFNDFGVVHRLTERAESETVVAFPKVLGSGFASELSEGPREELYGAVANSHSVGGSVSPGAFTISRSGEATPLGRLATSRQLSPAARFSRVARSPSTGDLFGTISEGGVRLADWPSFPVQNPAGFIYRIKPIGGSVSRVYQFRATGNPSDAPSEHGNTPAGALTPGPNSFLYGTTVYGGAAARGTFFKIDAAGNLVTLASFNEASGFGPAGDLIFSDGLFYGRTSFDGDNNTGTFFSVTPEGQITRIMSFPAGAHVTHNSRLILASDGNFYGAFAQGGEANKGSIFRLTKSGTLSTFASMSDAAGAVPLGVIEASDGNFYGVTAGTLDSPGSIFRLDRNGTVNVLIRFDSSKGTAPAANVMQASDGHLYGTTSRGGPSHGGVVYRLQILPTKQLLNISTRLRVQSGDNVLIGGFIVTGSQPKKVIVRALGPSLQQRGISGALANPVLELRGTGGALIASNDDWKTTQESEIVASGVPPADDLESAIVATLPPGDYTATVSGANASTGVGLVELYDLDQTADSRMANISTRGFVSTGEDVMIAGVIAGEGSNRAKAIVRAIGPSLQGSGVSNALANPILQLRDSNGNLIVLNDNWKDGDRAEIEASGVAPQHDLEAAIAITLPSGASTAVVYGYDDTPGVGLVEVYNVQ